MNIKYYFNGDDVNYNADITEYLDEKCSAQDLLDIAKDYWDDMPDDSKKQYIEDGIIKIDKSTPTDVISDIVSEIDDDWFKENRYDEIKDAFDDDAREEYNDNEAYRSDPLGYYGMRTSDFI